MEVNEVRSTLAVHLDLLAEPGDNRYSLCSPHDPLPDISFIAIDFIHAFRTPSNLSSLESYGKEAWDLGRDVSIDSIFDIYLDFSFVSEKIPRSAGAHRRKRGRI